jgi:epoxyqueuosine reductase
MAMNETLTEQVKKEALRLGARLVGIGSIDRWVNAPKGHKPTDFLPNARAVVAFALPQFKAMSRWREFMKGSEMFPEEIVEGLPTRIRAAYEMYGRMQYDALNLNLMSIAYYLGAFLNDLGYNVITPPITGGAGFVMTMVQEMYALGFHQWSQRHAAVACGLGELGLNNAFICPEYGLRTRLGSVITDAPLKADPLDRIGKTCTECDACTKVCPDPKPFGEKFSYPLLSGYELKVRRFNKKNCGGGACGYCTLACPVGR